MSICISSSFSFFIKFKRPGGRGGEAGISHCTTPHALPSPPPDLNVMRALGKLDKNYIKHKLLCTGCVTFCRRDETFPEALASVLKYDFESTTASGICLW